MFRFWLMMPLLLVAGNSMAAELVRLVPMLDLEGRTHALQQNDRRAVRVFVVLSTECPISRSYSPELARLATEFGRNKLPVEMFGVWSDSTVSPKNAEVSFRDEYKLPFPVLHDGAGLLARVLRPTHVPEVFVLDVAGQIAYRGAIDNAWEGLGRRRPRAEKTFLADAVRAIVDGSPVAVPQTKPVGCLFEDRLANGSNNAAVTFSRDIAPIIFTRCMNCHRTGQIAPFPLTNFAEVAKHAEMIVEVTQRRLMPPWMPRADPDAGDESRFVAERSLIDRELQLLKEWAVSGRLEGDPAHLPPTPRFAEGWQLGEPDLVVKMSTPYTVRAEGADLLQNFVIPIDIAEDKLVSAIEFHPGNKRVVHHAVLFLDDKGQARKLDAATPEPGYGNFGGPGFLPSGALGGWSVGNTARHLPNEMGRYLKKVSDLVVQVHYHPTGKEEVDQSEIGIYFVKKRVADSLAQPAKLVGSIWMANYEMDIPAEEKAYRRSTSYVLPRDVILVGVVPHMHLLGKSMRVTAMLPAAPKSITLIDVPAWNYNWQDEYYYERSLKLPAGTRLTVEAIYDNSAENPSNPSSPPKRVTWGDETTDEMLFCFFLLAADKTEDLIHTIFDNLGHDMKQSRNVIEPASQPTSAKR